MSVSQLNKYIHFKLQSDLKLKGIAVKGEISNFTVHYKSGHAYFTLKDSDSAIKAVMFAGNAAKLRFVPENGMSVLVVGNVDVYERDGLYQIVVTDIQPVGAGALHKGIEQLKDKLSKLGLFDEKLKKPIPIMPKRIAVVTSLTGAALQDILNVLSRRYPVCEVVISPAQVQGETASESIVTALKYADNCGADTIILARGGGSLEDLMPFNTEQVVMAVSTCKTPVITAVGHETDTSVVDYAADLRAPTPSAAAELASPELSELVSVLNHMTAKMETLVLNSLAKRNDRINNILNKLKLLSPEKRLERNFTDLKNRTEKLSVLVDRKIRINEVKLEKYAAQLSALSPLNVLERGYSITSKDSKIITKGEKLSSGDIVEITFSDTQKQAQII